MALYTLKSEDEAMNPELYKNRVQGFAGLGANSPELQLFNMFGRNSGGTSQPDDNFFAKKGKSIENALGTTGAFIAGGVDVRREDDLNKKRQEDAKKSIEDIIKSHGYNSKDEFYDASDKAEREIFGKYGFDSDDYWNKHAEMWSPAKANDKDVLNLEATRQDVINRMSQEDADTIRKFDSIQDEIKGQSKKNADIADKAARDWKDYRENSYIGQKTNQDRGKFLGSAINTLSTASDVMLPGAGVVFNTVQGGVEGIADELEQNGLKNFDWNRAGQNALSGALTGAVVGGVNKGINSALAKRGGNLLKGGNKLTQAINNFNANNPIGQIGSTLASGATRGAVSGAVGGATGAGLQSALTGQDIGQGVANALQGAVQGAQQGATTGAIMTGANMVANKTPGVGDMLQKFNQAGEDWNNSGENFGERWKNTRAQDTWGNRFLDEQVANANAIKNGLQDVGEGISALAQRGAKKIPGAVDALRESPLGNIGMSIQDVSGNGRQAVMPDDIKNMRINDNMTNIPEVEEAGSPETLLYRKIANENNNTKQSASANNAQNFQDGTGDWDNIAKEYGYNSYDEASQAYTRANPGKNANASDVLDWMDNRSVQLDVKAAKQRLRDAKADAKEVQAAKDLLNQVGTATSPAAKADNMVENVRRFMSEGLTTPEEWQIVSDAVTGRNGVMSKMYQNLISQAGDIDTFTGLGGKQGASLDDSIDYFIKNAGLTGGDAKGVKNEITGIIESLPSRAEGSLSMADSAEDVIGAVRKLEARKRNYMGEDSRNHQNADPRKDAKAEAIGKVATMLEDKIYEKVPDAQKVVTPEALQELKSVVPNNEKFAQSMEETFANIKTGKDLRAAQKRFVQTSDYLTNVRKNYGTYGQKVGDAAGNLLSQGLKKVPVVGGILAQATNTPFMNRRFADLNMAQAQRLRGEKIDFPSSKKVTDGAGEQPTLPINSTDVQANANQNYNPQTRLYDAIGRTEGAITRNNAKNGAYLAEAAQEAEIIPNATAQNAMMPMEMTAQPTASTALYNSIGNGNQMQANTMMNQTNAQSGNKYFPTTGDYWSDMIGEALSRAIDNDDVTAFAALFPMYKEAMSNVSKQSTKTSESSTAGKKLTATQQRANAAMNSLERISNMEPDLGYNLSGIPVIGDIATLGGNDYEAEAKSLAQQIGYMVSGANIKEEEAYNIGKAYVPQPFDSESTRRNKLQRAYEVIQQYQNGYAEE